MKIIKLSLLTVVLASLVFSTNSLLAQDCPTNLVSFWKLDETGGTSFIDAAGGHNATYDPTSDLPEMGAPGKLRQAATFDGTNMLDVSYDSEFAFTASSSFSIEFWVNFPAAPASYQIMLGSHDSDPATDPYWFIGAVPNTGALFFEISDDAGVTHELISAGNSYDNDSWHHVVAVRNGATDEMILYVDGAYSSSFTKNFTGNFPIGNDINIGYVSVSDVPSYHFTGSLDEVAIYDRVITPSEVATHYTEAVQGLGICDPDNPVIISTAVTTAAVGTPYSYKVAASGKPTMHYALVAPYPPTMTIDEFTGEISWTPGAVTDDGSVTVRAYNGFPPEDTQSFRIFIAEQPDCPTGLLGLWKLNETAGPTYIDSYGSRDGTAAVSPSSTTGIVNKGQIFNANTKIDLLDPDGDSGFDWTQNDDFSIEVWLKTSQTATMIAVGRHRPDGDTLAQWWVGLDAGVATFSLQDNGNPSKLHEISDLSSTNLADNNWHQVVAVYKGSSDDMFLYVDGAEANSVLSTTFQNSFKADVPIPVTVGYWDRNSPSDNEYHFVGALDEVAIFDKALSSADVSASYNLGIPTGYCAPGNYAPAITSTPIEEVDEGDLYSYVFMADDVDIADVLTLTAVTKPSWLNFSWTAGQKQATLSVTPTDAHVGSFPVTLRVSDGKIDVDQSYTLKVNNINDIPEITSTPQTGVNEDEPYTYTVTVLDKDLADVISISVQKKPTWLNFTYSAADTFAILAATPIEGQAGDSVVIAVNDGLVTIYQRYLLTVNTVNDPPVIDGQQVLDTDEDVAFTLEKSDLTITDADNPVSSLTLSLSAGANYTFEGTTITPAENYHGTLSVPVVVSDLQDDSDEFLVSITVNSVNDIPVITTFPSDEATVDFQYVYIFEATDADGDVLTLSGQVVPTTWMSFLPENGALIGTPTSANLGQNIVTLRVSDGTANVDTTWIITVTGGVDATIDNNMDEINIYPVPASDILSFDLGHMAGETTIRLMSSTGAIIRSESILVETENYSMDIDDLESGMYYVVITNNEFQYTKQISIVK